MCPIPSIFSIIIKRVQATNETKKNYIEAHNQQLSFSQKKKKKEKNCLYVIIAHIKRNPVI